MTLQQKLDLINLIETYGCFHGMFKEKLHAHGSKPEDYEFLKEIRDEKHAKIVAILETL